MSARDELVGRLVEHGDAASAEEASGMIDAYGRLPDASHDRLDRLVGLLRDIDLIDPRTAGETAPAP